TFNDSAAALPRRVAASHPGRSGTDPGTDYVMPPPEDPGPDYVMPPPEDPGTDYVMPPPEDPGPDYVMPPPVDGRLRPPSGSGCGEVMTVCSCSCAAPSCQSPA